MRLTYGGLLLITAAAWLDVVRSALAPDAMAGIDSDDTSGRPNGHQVGVAFVRCEPGASVTAADVIAYCRGHIASFKIPRHVLFVDDFPMTSSGKIQKVALREEALRRLPPLSSPAAT